MPDADDITTILHSISAGEERAYEQLMPLVYATLKRAARNQMQSFDPALSATELVHEAYLKLASAAPVNWRDRAHFFAVAARAMRQVLIDQARRNVSESRHRERERVNEGAAANTLDELIVLNDALERLGAVSERLRLVVEYRYFADLNEAEIAQLLGVSTRTVERDWLKARLWLHTALYPANDGREREQ